MSLLSYFGNKSAMLLNRAVWSAIIAAGPFVYGSAREHPAFWPYFLAAQEASRLKGEVLSATNSGDLYMELYQMETANAQATIISGSSDGLFFPKDRLADVETVGERLPDSMRFIENLPGDSDYSASYNDYAESVREAASTPYIDDFIMTASDRGMVGAENFGVGQALYGHSFEAVATGAALEFGFLALLAWQGFRAYRTVVDKDFNMAAKVTSIAAVTALAASIALAPALPLFLASEDVSAGMIKLACFGAVAAKAGAVIGCHKAISHGKKAYDRKLRRDFIQYET